MNKTLARILRVAGWLFLTCVVLLAAALYWVDRWYNSPPTVVLINASGGPVSHIVITIGAAEVAVPGALESGQRVQRMIPFRGSEASTDVSWVDHEGNPHQAHGNDYVEGKGGYRTTLVINPDGTLSQPRPPSPPVPPVPRPDRPK